MRRGRGPCGLLLGAALAWSGFAIAGDAPVAVTVNVAPGARQRFAGFGASLGNWGRDYQKLTPAERRQLSGLVHRNLKLKSLRLWLNLNEYAPSPRERTIADFRARYIDSGLIADAQACGVVDLLLAPDNAPPYMMAERDGGPLDFAVKDEALDAYGDLIAEFLAQVRAETGVLINVTGVQNEPNNLDRMSPEQMPRVVKALRRGLDARGLRAVKVIAPEAANVDAVAYDTLDRLKADPDAWAALGGVAAHSYDMAATPEFAAQIEGPGGSNLKDYWMTEASDVGPESPGDAARGASLASRFLNDVNHRATHWIHFLGFEVPDPNDDATRIVAYTTGPLRTTVFHKYDYYHQLSGAFDVGAAFRRAEGGADGGMTWTYGPKPALSAAAARNPDGSWAIGLSNFTGADPKSGSRPAQAFDITVVVPELAPAGEVQFRPRRSGPHATDASRGEVAMVGGRVTVRVGPLELVTLRSAPAAGVK